MEGEGMPIEGEVEGFMGEMWNGIFYGPGQEAALNQARIDYPSGWMNGEWAKTLVAAAQWCTIRHLDLIIRGYK